MRFVVVNFIWNVLTESCCGKKKKKEEEEKKTKKKKKKKKKKKNFMVSWLISRITRRWTEVCFKIEVFQPWHDPLWLTRLKVPTNWLTIFFFLLLLFIQSWYKIITVKYQVLMALVCLISEPIRFTAHDWSCSYAWVKCCMNTIVSHHLQASPHTQKPGIAN